MSRFDVVVLDRLPDYILSPLKAVCQVHDLHASTDLGTDLARLGHTVRGLISFNLAKPLTSEFLKRFSKLELIAHHGVGYDAIDTKWCASHGIVVTNTPDVLNEEVADLAMGLLLSTVRQIPQADAFFRSGKWTTGSFPLTASLQGRSLGIFGLGRIGKAIARRAEAFGLPIAYHNRRLVEGTAYTYHVSLKALAAASDILLLIAPGGSETQHVVDKTILEALGPDGILINVARGSLVNEVDLLEALQTGAILGAGLDVYENEPRPREEFAKLPNVVVLPHVGSASLPTRHAMGSLMVENVRSFASGAGPVTPVAETPWTKA